MDILAQVRGHALAEVEHSKQFRQLSLDERGKLVRAACRGVTRLYEGRIASGLPPRIREEWPRSTWEFLKRHARRTSSGNTET
jgi:hypothetical protein